MKMLASSLILLAVAASSCHGKIDRTTFNRVDQIVTLDDWNYNHVIKKINFLVVLFYENNRDGRIAVEEYVKAKNVLVTESEDLDFAKIDMTKYKKINKEYPVGNMPLFRMFKHGKYFDYHGEVTSEHVVTWAHLALNIPLEINVANELDELKQKKSVILGCFPNKSPQQSYDAFIQASENYIYDPMLQLPRFAIITSSRVARATGIAPGQVAVFKKWEEQEKHVFEGNSGNLHELEKFLADESYPFVHKHNFEGIHKAVHRINHHYKHVLFMDPKDQNFKETYKNFREAARTYAKKTKDVLFIYADPSRVPEETRLGFFHVDVNNGDTPCNRVVKRDRFASKFRPTRTDFSYRGFIKFTDDVVSGREKRSIKSEIQPSDWDTRAVKVLVGTTYESFMHQNRQKHVLVLYYGPGQEKSDAVLPEFEKAATEMPANQRAVFAKLDVLQNDGEVGSGITYPTLVLHFPGGDRTKLYNGKNFKSTDFVKFVTSDGTSTPPDGYEKMMHELAEDRVKMEAKMEDLFIKEDEERRVEWEKEEKELLANAIERKVGQTIDELPEHQQYEKDHEDNPLEHDPHEHVEAAIGKWDL